MELYRSRLAELRDRARRLTSRRRRRRLTPARSAHQGVDYFKELTYPERKAIHNLKYFTWVEQQGKTARSWPRSGIRSTGAPV